MTLNRHEPWEELISASLHGDLTADERARLDAHLDTCAECRATLAAFSDGRRIVAGLRHVAPPRDLQARVLDGIERGGGGLPWWRRPPLIFAGVGGALAVAAGAVLAFVLLNGTPDHPVGQSTPTASPSGSPTSAAPSPSASTSPAESAPSSPVATPPPAQPEPDVYLALTGPFDAPQLAIRDAAGNELARADAPGGEPIAAELSPDGQWLAYVTVVGASGMNEVRATRIAEASAGGVGSPVDVGGTVSLGRSMAGSPFLDHLAWSPDGTALAFTLASPDDASIDAWLFEPATGAARQLTAVGDAYAASWAATEGGGSLLWVSVAGETPRSYLLEPSAVGEAVDPADSPFPNAENVFQPLVSPDRRSVIFWSGVMDRAEVDWRFIQGGQPWIAENVGDGQGGYDFANPAQLFSDLTVGLNGFESAAITWGEDSDAYAVWDAAWTGESQSSGSQYPDPSRVYFSHASDARAITASHALDAADLPADGFVVDVKVSPTGRHLVITAGQPRPGDLSPATADLLLVARNTGSVADEVTPLASAADGWFGPAAFDRVP